MAVLLKSQKLKVWEILRARKDFSPQDFNYQESSYSDGVPFDVISYGDSPWYFQFAPEHVYYSPGESQLTDTMPWTDWGYRQGAFNNWLGYLKRETDAEAQGDLWGTAPARNFAEAAQGADNRMFTPEEQRRIAETLLTELPKIARQLKFQTVQIKELQATTEYLVGATKRFGRKDWMGLFIGNMFNYLSVAAVPPDAARAFFDEAIRSLNWLFGYLVHGTPQPLLPG